MGESVSLMGMVLTAMPIGDYDKRITILTRDRGKITAFARGAKRPNSQLLACTNPLTFGEFELFEGKSAFNLAKANVSNYFLDLKTDLDKTYMGLYFTEFCEYFCQENNDEKEMLKLLYQSIRALESGKYDNDLVRFIFEFKAMCINGEGPNVFSCMHCKKKENLHAFSVKRGGIFCEDCGKIAKGIDAFYISDTGLSVLQYLTATAPEKVFSFKLSKEVLDELKSLMTAYMGFYVRHKFKSLEFLD